MKVLLTGANGFVGSRMLAALRARQIPTTVLLRPTSRRHLITELLANVEVRSGAIDDLQSLESALRDVTHVIHCAGKTKALRTSEYHEVNAAGTRNLVAAINHRRDQINRLIHISSLAASRPALPGAPAREDDSPAPVSEYGRSKLAGEREVCEGCQADFVILRPPAVYGPGDTDFLKMFKAARYHLCPRFGKGLQPLSLVFVDDLAEVALTCLNHPNAAGRVYHVAHPEVVTAGALAGEIARQMHVRTLCLPLPMAVLGLICVLQETMSHLTARPATLSRERYRELHAPGWACDSTRLRVELGLVCPTPLPAGIARTLEWYRRHGWLGG